MRRRQLEIARLLGIAVALGVVGCAGPADGNLATAGLGPTDGVTTDANDATSDPASGSTTGPAGTSSPTTGPDASSDTTAAPGSGSSESGATAMDCVYASTNFGSPLQELDIMGDPGSSFRLSFSVPGLPAANLITSASLAFRSFDADHPGEEGLVYVNGGAGLDLPANVAWDNAEGMSSIDVTGLVLEGSNQIEFGPGPLDRSFYQIGDVELLVAAAVDECEPQDESATDSGTGMGVEQTVQYTDATYTQRHNWVLRCEGFEYAFTAANPKHIPSDCGDLYDPDGSAHGTATFHFPKVVEDDYMVEVHARYTFNRNPNGALVIVDGVSGIVDQRTNMEGEAYFETAEWGVAHLVGDVDIVLDSSQGGYGSDSVTWIRIVPQ